MKVKDLIYKLQRDEIDQDAEVYVKDSVYGFENDLDVDVERDGRVIIW